MIISDYDKFDYNYQQYWKGRSYEHRSEIMALRKLFNGVFGNFFLDIGGSYGRLTETYYERFESPIIVDYSLKTLQNNKRTLQERYPRLMLIAANAYRLPFEQNVFDGAMMVRVLHHIEQPNKYLKELTRVMQNRAVYIQEFPNKNHLKARIRAILKGDLKFFAQETYQQPTQMSFEGSNGQETVFLNFHPRYIKGLLQNNGFKITGTLGTSFLRIPLIKRIIPETLLLLFEKVAQLAFSRTYVSPSIMFRGLLNKEAPQNPAKGLDHVLACPKCRGKLSLSDSSARCVSCETQYQKNGGIWDFRI